MPVGWDTTARKALAMHDMFMRFRFQYRSGTMYSSFSTSQGETLVSAERVSDAAVWRRRLEQRRRRQFYSALGGVVGAALMTFAVIKTMEDSMIFFYTPTQVLEELPPTTANRRMRLGGLVVSGSLQRHGNGDVEFEITDLENEVLVTFNGFLPDLFREGQSAVVEGYILERENDGRPLRFKATSVLAKHDEKYMPAQVRSMLEKNRPTRSDTP
jgi:cytochrome c-type biogenesis protein CcmE